MKALFLPAAEAEHLSQVVYYESRQRGLGARYLAEVTAAVAVICDAPHRFPIVHAPMLRRLSLKRFPFAIYFRERDGIVVVAAVAPHRRRPGYWLGRT